MYVMIVTDDDDYITFPKCLNIDNEDNSNYFKFSLLSIPSSIFFFSLLSLMIYTLFKTLMKHVDV